jgi:hypothetical protein
MTRTMGRHRTNLTPHTDWCARDHRCGLTEHRSPELIADAIGGRAVITRIRAGTIEYAEIRARIPLHHTETGAHWQITTLLRLIRKVLAAVAVRRGVLDSHAARPAIDSRPA